MNAEELYREAYELHYKKKDYAAAYKGYLKVMEKFPQSPESQYAKAQIENLSKIIDLSAVELPPDLSGHAQSMQQEKQALEEKKAAELAEEEYKNNLFKNAVNIENLIAVNKDEKKWTLPRKLWDGGIRIDDIYDFKDLVEFDVFENNSSVPGANTSGAVIGGMLFGATGAIVGSTMKKGTQKVNDLHITLTINDFNAPKLKINILDTAVLKDSPGYRHAVNTCEEIVSLLRLIIDDNNNTGSRKKIEARAIYAFSVADEIMKFKQMMDDGIITPEEYETQKKKLLSLDY